MGDSGIKLCACGKPKHRGMCEEKRAARARTHGVHVIKQDANAKKEDDSADFPINEAYIVREQAVGILGEQLRVRQQIGLDFRISQMPQDWKDRLEKEKDARRLLIWFASPYADKEPKTMAELAIATGKRIEELGMFEAIHHDLIAATIKEIASVGKQYATLRYMDVLVALVDKAIEERDVRAFQFVREIVEGIAVAPPTHFDITANITVNDILNAAEKEEAKAPLPSGAKQLTIGGQ